MFIFLPPCIFSHCSLCLWCLAPMSSHSCILYGLSHVLSPGGPRDTYSHGGTWLWSRLPYTTYNFQPSTQGILVSDHLKIRLLTLSLSRKHFWTLEYEYPFQIPLCQLCYPVLAIIIKYQHLECGEEKKWQQEEKIRRWEEITDEF